MFFLLMGYMGFGMKKWIYNRKPRKPFNKREIKTGDEIDRYERSFKLRDNEEKDSKLKALGTLLILFALVAIAAFLMINADNKYKEANKQKEQTRIREEKKAREFILKSGINYMESKNYEKARYEFELLLKKDPKNLSGNYNYSVLLLNLCKLDSIPCQEAENQIQQSLTYYPDHKVFLTLRDELIVHQQTQNRKP